MSGDIRERSATVDKSERDMRQEWETPDDFFGVVDEEFRFDIDVCATAQNAKCVVHISPEMDALAPGTRWLWPGEGQLKPNTGSITRAWCNPGFAKPEPWLRKACFEATRGPFGVVVVMALVAPSTKWWRNWAMKASAIRLLTSSHPDNKRFKSRLQFKPPKGVEESSNDRENCLIIFRQNPHNLPPRIWMWDWTKDLP